jgi:DNA invertase Pin-like site-specific DNA recombinase
MENQNLKKLPVLIYCRVSSKRQVKEGHGLDSQEHRCNEWVNRNKLKVEETFREDESASGAFFDRPAMKKLIAYLDKNPHKKYIVLFDDLKRFARDVAVHLRLKKELVETRSVILECLNFNFEDSPEGRFVEIVFAGQSQLEREQNRRQVIQKQKARLERGYWPFCPPPALVNKESKIHGKILIPREPLASIFKDAIEGYAKNLLITQEDVKKFIFNKYREQDIDRPISIHGVQRLLINPLYAGYIEYEPWEVPRIEGQHEGFISKELFKQVEDKFYERSKPKIYKTHRKDFPLRRFVECAECGSKLRASWNRGNGGRYPYYWCQCDECKYKYKVTKAWDIHQQFENLLVGKKMPPELLGLTKAIFDDAWADIKNQYQVILKANSNRLKSIDLEVNNLAVRAGKAKIESVAQVYEKQMGDLLKEKENLEQESTPKDFSQKKFGTSLERVLNVLENPLLLWNSDNVVDQQTLLYMYFEKGLAFDYENGFGTINFSLAINLLSDVAGAKNHSVEMGGYEPPSVS